MEQSKSYQEGFDDGWAGLTNPDRFHDPQYLEGAIAGAFHWDRFISSTVDHVRDFTHSAEPAPPKMMRLEGLNEAELVSAPSAVWPFNSFFDSQPNVKGTQIRLTALC